MGFGFSVDPDATGFNKHAEAGLSPIRSPEEAFGEPKYEILHNPLTDEYYELKDWVTADEITFTRQGYTGLQDEVLMPYNYLELFGHTLLGRPVIEVGEKYRVEREDHYRSPKRELAATVLQQIGHANGFEPEIYRMNINLTKCTKAARSIIHRDHDFDHWNLIIYLSTFHGGRTYVDNEPCPEPREDLIVTFEGKDTLHWHEPPEGIDDNRFILVATYMPREIDSLERHLG